MPLPGQRPHGREGFFNNLTHLGLTSLRFIQPMKSTILRRAVMILLLAGGLSIGPVLAQSSGNATMTVNLADVLQLTVNTATVTLNFATPTDYKNGVSSSVPNQISVTCNRAYDLKVRTTTATLTSGANTIPVSNVSAQANYTGQSAANPSVALSTTDQSLATGVPASISRQVNLNYSTSAGNQDFLRPAGAYTTTLTFTAVAN
ncbi:hypothetical protein FAES_5097 [Fibrella aestuarina BUZ 2]|uniref:Spore coat protein U domain-containing protein n=2 Tax=Fibrella TaxID=861914 RepID=I0KG43_9BACT|nr:hypothetical protein FAES_5097 [Fibrella aestuarina BUZ 2]